MFADPHIFFLPSVTIMRDNRDLKIEVISYEKKKKKLRIKSERKRRKKAEEEKNGLEKFATLQFLFNSLTTP